jgi:hypothetical protein
MSQGRYITPISQAGAKLYAAIMAGADAKEAAIRHGMSWSYANRLARDAGLTRRLLTAQEWDDVLLARSAVLTGRARLTRDASVRA